MGAILDTSILIAFERQAVDANALAQGREQGAVGISVITAAELLHGGPSRRYTTRRMRRAAYVEKVLDQLTVYPFDRAAARTSADLWATLQKRRIQIGVHAVMMAATALSLGFLVTTLNVRDYEKIEGLALEYGGRDG